MGKENMVYLPNEVLLSCKEKEKKQWQIEIAGKWMELEKKC